MLSFGCTEDNKTSHTAANLPTESTSHHDNPQQPIEQQPTEQQPTEQQPTEQQPTEQQPTEQQPTEQQPTEQQQPVEQEVSKLSATIDSIQVTIQWEDNDSVNALREMAQTADITIKMSQYGGFEQVGSLGQSLPRNDVQTTTAPGDIVLYSGNQIVVFYGSNSWSYTRLGKITDKTEDELKALLDKDNVTMQISLGD
ncbi:MAG: hypothetical protein J6A01_08665 [Proteobacteria bacterium]|nr:hypothetical protein [Pseudomonadota bacterium]